MLKCYEFEVDDGKLRSKNHIISETRKEAFERAEEEWSECDFELTEVYEEDEDSVVDERLINH